MVRFSRELYSYVDYANKVTLTILDECEQADKLINEFYISSPNRVSDHILKRLNCNRQDLIHQMPTQYIYDLDYTHSLFKLDMITRLSLFFSQFNEYYWVTKEQFPKKPLSTFEDFCEFILETYPKNLDNRIMPYYCLAGSFKEIRGDLLIKKEISGELLIRLNEYYNPLHS